MPDAIPAPTALTFDPDITTALGLGWQMAELYNEAAVANQPAQEKPDDLPGISSLGTSQLFHLRLDQILSGISRLGKKVSDGGLSIDKPKGQVMDAINRFAPPPGTAAASGGPLTLAEAVLAVHVQLLDVLTAVDASLGKAYALGRALADLAMRPSASTRAAFLDDFGGRIQTLKGWLRDLRTLLPNHASAAVSRSIDLWMKWIEQTAKDDAIWNQPAPWRDPLHPTATTSLVTSQLYTQGTRWRTILTGELKATEILETTDYVAAGEALLQRLGSIGLRFLRQFWLPLTTVVVVVVAAVVLLLYFEGGTGGGISALGAIAAGIGVSWKGIDGTLVSAIRKAEPPLWGAELDLAIAASVTNIPGEADAVLRIPWRKGRYPHVTLTE